MAPITILDFPSFSATGPSLRVGVRRPWNHNLHTEEKHEVASRWKLIGFTVFIDKLHLNQVQFAPVPTRNSSEFERIIVSKA